MDSIASFLTSSIYSDKLPIPLLSCCCYIRSIWAYLFSPLLVLSLAPWDSWYIFLLADLLLFCSILSHSFLYSCTSYLLKTHLCTGCTVLCNWEKKQDVSYWNGQYIARFSSSSSYSEKLPIVPWFQFQIFCQNMTSNSPKYSNSRYSRFHDQFNSLCEMTTLNGEYNRKNILECAPGTRDRYSGKINTRSNISGGHLSNV